MAARKGMQQIKVSLIIINFCF